MPRDTVVRPHFAGAVVLIYAGIPRRVISITTIVLTLMLAALALRLAWNGWSFQMFFGFWLLHGLAVSLRGNPPFVLETLVFAAECVPGGYQFFSRINDRLCETVLEPVDDGRPSRLLNFGLPIAAAVAFGGIFIMANPDVVNWVSANLGQFAEKIRDFLFQFSIWEVLFWWLIAWLTGGLLRPVLKSYFKSDVPANDGQPIAESAIYPAFRNTLVTVIVLFSVYLSFEFYTLWFRDFPAGFHYSGYAHEGAAWLTAALALATVMLSLIFRGLTLTDPRLPTLKKLAWGWSVLNFILVVAVYNRLYIYIDFNGMTRMRTIGLLGISSVVGGFILVLVKINRARDFLWLVRRQLWILGIAVYLYLILPVDVLVHRYNVAQITSGNLAPVVQVTGHEMDDEALSVLLPLCDVEDERVRDGVKSFLALRFESLVTYQSTQQNRGWTAKQVSRDRAFTALKDSRDQWDTVGGRSEQQAKWKDLQDFAYRNWW